MIQEELKPKPRRTKSPEEKAAEVAAQAADNRKKLEEKGEFVSPLKLEEVPTDEPVILVAGEPPVIDDPNYQAALEAAVEVFGDDMTPETKAAVEEEIRGPRGRVNETPVLTLAAKVVEVMAAIDAVEKKGRNEAMKYNYQKAVDVTKEVRREFIKHGLTLVTSTRNLRTTVLERDGKTPNLYAEVDMDFVLTDGVESFTFHGVGAGMDAGDKGVYKAITGALKYGLRTLLLIPDERDDPEVPRMDEIAETVSIPNAGPIVIESSNIKNVKQGGRQQVATIAQIQAIKAASNELMIEPAALAAFIDVELGDSPDLSVAKDITEEGKIIMDYLVGLTFEQCGRIVKGLVEAVEKQRNGGA